MEEHTRCNLAICAFVFWLLWKLWRNPRRNPGGIQGGSEQTPLPLTLSAFAIPLSPLAESLGLMAPKLSAPRELFARLWGSCANHPGIPWFNDIPEPQPRAAESHGQKDSVHFVFSKDLRHSRRFSWKMCQVFQHVKFWLLGNEISVLSLILGDRGESENGCVWDLFL